MHNLVFFFLLFCLTLESLAKQSRILDISDYLSKINSLSANFIQIDSNGDESLGTLKIQQPEKFRIDYTEGSSSLIISDGKKLALINKKLPSISFYTKDQFPINFLLSSSFNLNKFTIIDFEESENKLEIQLSYKAQGISNNFRLIFEDNPLSLRKWIIFDENNNKTEILLTELSINEDIDNRSFKIEDPTRFLHIQNN